MTDSPIEWTDLTWNPVRGCQRVSPGCTNCYAEKTANRFRGEGRPYHGLIRINAKGKGVWTGRAREVPELLAKPLSWRRRAADRLMMTSCVKGPSRRNPAGLAPRLRVFVNSMSDLFHKDVSFEFIAAVYGVMSACPDIDFLVLTKRPARMVEWYEWTDRRARHSHILRPAEVCFGHAGNLLPDNDGACWDVPCDEQPPAWPLPNVHVGVSVEDQQRADERIPLLLKVPAAVRWVSAEPLLEFVGLDRWLRSRDANEETRHTTLDWVVVGGESGPGARPYDLSWPRALIEQCQAAGVPVFHKQLGSGCAFRHKHADGATTTVRAQPDSSKVLKYAHPKGADMSEWPAGLRVREYPEASR